LTPDARTIDGSSFLVRRASFRFVVRRSAFGARRTNGFARSTANTLLRRARIDTDLACDAGPRSFAQKTDGAADPSSDKRRAGECQGALPLLRHPARVPPR